MAAPALESRNEAEEDRRNDRVEEEPEPSEGTERNHRYATRVGREFGWSGGVGRSWEEFGEFSAVGLAVGGDGERGEVEKLPRDHVGWDALTEAVFDFGGADEVGGETLVGEDDHGDERLDLAIFFEGENYGIGNFGEGAKIGFEVAEFDPIAVEFDLIILATFEEEMALASSSPVTCVVGWGAFEGAKGLGVEVGATEVAWADIGADDDDFAAFALGNDVVEGIEDEDLGTCHGAADGEWGALVENRGGDLDGGRGDGGFGGAIGIPDLGFGKAVEELASDFCAEGFAAEEEALEVGEEGFGESAFGEADLGEGGGGDPSGDL